MGRREETKQLHADGYEPVLSNSRYCFLKRTENLSDKQNLKLDEVLQYDLKSVRAYYLQESFDAFWHDIPARIMICENDTAGCSFWVRSTAQGQSTSIMTQ
ncbi:MAG: hypothetical protein ACI9JZ_001035 [Lentimonas sp.]|jgi:hypothetical protein